MLYSSVLVLVTEERDLCRDGWVCCFALGRRVVSPLFWSGVRLCDLVLSRSRVKDF